MTVAYSKPSCKRIWYIVSGAIVLEILIAFPAKFEANHF